MKKILLMLLIMLSSLFAGFQNDILEVDEAFKLKVTHESDNIHTVLKIADEIYVYDEQLKYEIVKPKEVNLDKKIKRPSPVEFHEFSVHRKGDVVVDIPLTIIKEAIGDKDFTLKVSYQGCSEKGLCYQPMQKSFDFNADGTLKTEAKEKPKAKKTWGTKIAELEEKKEIVVLEKSEPVEVSEEDAIANKLKDSSFFAVLALFFGFGLALSLTPCIFPMIPILSSIITLESKQSGHMSMKRGIFLAFVYIASSALVYALAGILSAVFGANILSAMQNPWIIVIFSILFVALAFSMFGYYEIQIPQSLQNFANQKSDKAKGTGVTGIAVMGALSALIVGPCVAPPLAGALIFIGQTGDVLLGGLALFLLGLGMGAPLLLIGAGGGKFMPKPGGWMTKVSYVFGVVMLGIAISFLSRILPDMVTMILWAFLFIGSGIYSGALEPLKDGISGLSKLVKVFAFAMLAYGTILLVGAFSGGNSVLDPLKKLYTSNTTMQVAQSNHFKNVKTVDELLAEVEKSTKPILIDFSADWCAACKELEEITFPDPTVVSLMSNFTLLRVDVTDNNDNDKALMKKYGVVGPPAIIFYNSDKKELKNNKMIGYKPPNEFIPILKKALGQ